LTPTPGMLKWMTSRPGWAFACRMAWRNEPASGLTLLPLSPVVTTVKVEGTRRSSSASTPRRVRRRCRDCELLRADERNNDENSMQLSLRMKTRRLSETAEHQTPCPGRAVPKQEKKRYQSTEMPISARSGKWLGPKCANGLSLFAHFGPWIDVFH